MKAPLSYLSAVIMAVPLIGYSQSKNDKPILQHPQGAVLIDGNLTEWGDSLRYFNAEKKINYTIANDSKNIYVAVMVNDHSEQQRILMAGITFSINPKGKKKEAYSVTFPYTDPESKTFERPQPPADGQQPQPGNEDDDREERMQAHLSKLKQIKATGFKDVEYEIMSTSNTYGIKTALNFDKNGYLIYEAAIPISMLHADDADKNEWAFNIRINGITKPKQAGGPEGGGRGGMGGGGMGGGRGGMGGGGRGGMGGGGGRHGGGMRGGGPENSADRGELAKSIDFWDKFYLAGK